MRHINTRFSSIAILIAASMLWVACDHKKSNSMTYRPLGNTGIEVSEIGIGCAAFEKMDTAESRAFMQTALDSGVNCIDIYTPDPEVRDKIGYALKGRRDKMVIQGHVGCWWNGDDYERTRDVKLCRKGFEDLLTRLGTDHVEVGMIHIVDAISEWDSLQGTPYMDYIQQLKRDGKILHVGLSTHNAEVALKAAKSGLVEVIMFSLNPAFDRITSDNSPWDPELDKKMLPGIDPIRVELYDYCARNHIAITVMKAFGSGGGRLLDASKSPLHVALTVDQCIAYALDKACVASCLCGCCSIEELLADLHYLHATEAEKDYNAVLNGTSQRVSAGECNFCGHCAPCAQGIDIAKVNELLEAAEAAKAQGKEIPAEVQQAYDALSHHASECTSCGQCNERCPFGVDVPAHMQRAVQVFGK